MAITPKVQAEFDEQIATFFHRAPSRAEAQKQLARHCDDILAQLPGMVALLDDYPVYAGVAFYGKMQVTDRKLVARLSAANSPAEAAIEAIRCQKGLKIAASAKAGWDFLLKNHQKALWNAIQLNSHGVKTGGSRSARADDEEDEGDGEEAADSQDEREDSGRTDTKYHE